MASRLVELRTGRTTVEDRSTSGLVHKETDNPPVFSKKAESFMRRTYHLRPDQIDRIERSAFHHKLAISDVVRRAVDAWLEENETAEPLGPVEPAPVAEEPPIDASERYYTPAQVAEYFAVPVPRVGFWLRAGRLQGVKTGRDWRVSASALERFVQDGTPTD